MPECSLRGIRSFQSVPRASARQRSALLKDELERLVVEAKRLSLDLDALIDAVKEHWENLSAGGENLPFGCIEKTNLKSLTYYAY